MLAALGALSQAAASERSQPRAKRKEADPRGESHWVKVNELEQARVELPLRGWRRGPSGALSAGEPARRAANQSPPPQEGVDLPCCAEAAPG